MGGAPRLAHRGDWRQGPENSLGAMRAALANPACDGLEFDVRGAKDGTPILLHDATLARVQGRPERPAALSVDELAELGVPTLESVLAVAGRTPFLDIELKGEPVRGVIELVERYRGPSPDRTVISSFEPETLAWLAERRPAWTRWLNAEDLEPATLARALELGCQAVSVDWRAITRPGLQRLDAAGLELATWTVRRNATAARLDRLGAVAICVEAAALDG